MGSKGRSWESGLTFNPRFSEVRGPLITYPTSWLSQVKKHALFWHLIPAASVPSGVLRQ